MLAFVNENGAAFQVGASLLTAAVWVVYLQIIVRQFIRQRRTHILINVGASTTLDARCFVANLAFEPVYVSDIVLILRDHDHFEATITDRTDATEGEEAPPNIKTYQGPLRSGEYLDIGSFRDLIERAARAAPIQSSPLDYAMFGGFDIIAVANTPASSSIAAAVRSFDLTESEGTFVVVPRSIDTYQIRSARRLRRIKRDLEERMLRSAGIATDDTTKARIASDLPAGRLSPTAG